MASAADLPVDLVEDIFLRFEDTADLARASAACASFHRLVSDGRFLRHYRSLHRPPVVGILSTGFRFHPAEPPRRSAQAARAVSRAAGFSSSFLPANPTEHYWHVHDARDGRVLLSPTRSGRNNASVTCLSFSYLVIYNPLSCKHVKIPPIPNDLVACTCAEKHGCHCCCDCDCEFNPFLVPDADKEDNLSFQVMCTVLSAESNVLEIFVYSSVIGKWRGMASLSDADYEPLHRLSCMERYYAHGCFYWVNSSEKDMLVLDMNNMKFSVVRLPPRTKNKFKIVVKAAEDSNIALLVFHSKHKLHLYGKAFGANDCWLRRHKAAINFLDSYEWLYCDADHQGYALLQGIPRDEYCTWRRSPNEMKPKNAHYFTLELQTLLLEQLCVTEFDNGPVFLYASFPPPFAPPRL